ncbi:hypothetical protein SPAR100_1342 [Streptococcus pneumoniae GA47562]|nr:hypothetical protein SPAR100_1342 [Streptococcus pneumoniae GA47562]
MKQKQKYRSLFSKLSIFLLGYNFDVSSLPPIIHPKSKNHPESLP